MHKFFFFGRFFFFKILLFQIILSQFGIRNLIYSFSGENYFEGADSLPFGLTFFLKADKLSLLFLRKDS